MELIKEFDKQGNFLFKYRGTLPIIILVLGLYVHASVKSESESYLTNGYANNTYEFICLAIALLGLWIRVLTIGYAQKNTSGRNTAAQVADSLNTSGMYSTVRHPLYVGNFFMWLGVAMLTEHTWFIIAFILAYWLYYERIMYAEEQFISKKFGKAFTDWAAVTPAMIPNFAKWSNPNLTFCTKKVLRQEKNGFAAIFILFFIFDVVAEYYTYDDIEFRNRHWLVLCILSVIVYFVLKFLKNTPYLISEDKR
tara:strand:- start:1551 stop:2306 length:756 start_codon:yes stop_codon:yes gene_type:complete